jgi:hypothetical protein
VREQEVAADPVGLRRTVDVAELRREVADLDVDARGVKCGDDEQREHGCSSRMTTPFGLFSW